MNNSKEYELAKERAAKYGFDHVTYECEYEGGNLFLALKSIYMHKCAGFPMYILIKGSDVTVLPDEIAWSLIHSNY